MKNILLLAVFCLVSCSSNGNYDVKASHRKPVSGSKVFKPEKEWEIKSEKDLDDFVEKTGSSYSQKDGVIIVDMKGSILDGIKQKGDGGQSESQTPLFRAKVPLVLKNGFIRNNKDAATFYAPNSGVEKVTWLTVGEDAVATAPGAKNFKIENCEFINNKNGDKSIQLNEANGARIYNNLIYGGITGVRLGEAKTTESRNKAFCSKNIFVDVDTAWNIAKMSLKVEQPNEYIGVRVPFKTTGSAKIENIDGKLISQ
jgi:hypothetical protein